MKINILYKFHKGPWGGGNQFLKAIRKEFIKKGVYEENPEKADVILFNSYPFRSEYYFREVLKLKQKYPRKNIIYRLNGPVSFIRGKDRDIDKIIALFNKIFIDGIIFQSNYCKELNKKHFGISSEHQTVIYNASDKNLFNNKGKKEFNSKEKIKLIATSWSSNWRKGFEIYRYLDENLDFSKYEMCFVGNSPVEFKNIKYIKPVSSEKLAELLKEHDIYISASQNDPCSNSLIEALSCNLPAVALNGGGHPELVQKGGELFQDKEDIIEKIKKVAQSYHYYQSQIPEYSIEKIANNYYEFLKIPVQSKEINFFTKINLYRIKCMILKWKIFGFLS